MTDAPAEDQSASFYERWQDEQKKWQQLIMEYVDRAGTDERFLINLGNAMRGSLMANKPYPGTTVGGGPAEPPVEQAALDEVLFAVRRLEGQVLELTIALDQLASRAKAPRSRKAG